MEVQRHALGLLFNCLMSPEGQAGSGCGGIDGATRADVAQMRRAAFEAGVTDTVQAAVVRHGHVQLVREMGEAMLREFAGLLGF